MSLRLFRVSEHIVPAQHIRQYPRATQRPEDELQLSLKQYTPLDNVSPQPGDITLIAAHANGVGKELYEPLWDELVQRLHNTTDVRIRGIWIADVAFQGASGVLNEKKLGNDPSWWDHPRDLLYIINQFSREMPQPIFGMGHSMGGMHITQLALNHPRLFSGLILIDPVIVRGERLKGNYAPAYQSTFRRDIWLSREEAAESFRKNPFYQRWDPRVLDLWIKHGLRKLPTAVHPSSSQRNAGDPYTRGNLVTLTTTKHQEVLTFMRAKHPKAGTSLNEYVPDKRTHPDIPPDMENLPFYRPEPIITFSMLPHLRPRVFYVFAEESDLSAEEAREDKLAVTGTGVGGNGGTENVHSGYGAAVQDVLMKSVGHFAPFEEPKQVADLTVDWLQKEMERVRQENEMERAEWAAVREGRSRGFMLDDDYIRWMDHQGITKLGKKSRIVKPSTSKI